MTIVARAGGNGEGMAGNGMTFHRRLGVTAGAGQVAINAANPGSTVNAVCHVLRVILMASGAEGIRCGGHTSTLGVDLVAVNTRHAHFAVAAR